MKTFLKIFIPVLFASMFCLSCAEQPAEEKMDVCLQLYSVRSVIGTPDLYAANGKEALKTLAEMGYTSVEAATYSKSSNGLFYGVSPEEFRADVEAAGLESLSSHVCIWPTSAELASGDCSDALSYWDETISVHKRAGMGYIVIPAMTIPANLAELKVFCDYLNEVGKKCAEEGVKFGYHSHEFEFQKIEDCVIYDFMLQNTDPEYVFFQMDVYWAVIGDVSPVEYFKSYPGRFESLHIKDHFVLGDSGMVGFDAIFQNFDVSGTKFIVVEQEETVTNDWAADMQGNIDYLRWLKNVLK